jgi:hypothetical protein
MTMRPDISAELAALRRRVEALEAQAQAPYKEFRNPAGVLRVRVGRQTDGTWGLRAWNAAGALVINQVAPA